jgi:glycosyltransferase involved in cell wall biosynthesis
MSSPRSKSISVLIPAFNEELLIRRSIRAVQESFAAVEWDRFEIIVCDNNSTDRTAEEATAGGAKVVFEPHNQIARARNRAAGAATGDWLIFVDGDTFLNPQLLERTIENLQSGSICGGGAVIQFDRAELSRGAAWITKAWNRLSSVLHLAAGSYLYCYREAWEETGGFEEKVYAGEELFFSRKVRCWGKKRGLRFRVITDAPITTSARKLEWYGPWQMLGHMLIVMIPGAILNRRACALWYTRPAHTAAKEG